MRLINLKQKSKQVNKYTLYFRFIFDKSFIGLQFLLLLEGILLHNINDSTDR